MTDSICVAPTSTSISRYPLEPNRQATEQTDWLLDGTPYTAGIYRNATNNELILSNGLLRRIFRLTPNAATVGFDNLATGEALLRGVKAEAEVQIDGVHYEIGGLKGQPNYAFLRPAWLNQLTADPNAFQFTGLETGQPQQRMPWTAERCASRHA